MVNDPFIPAVEELAQALSDGEDLEPTLEEIAQEHGFAPQALRNRAVRALGPLDSYRERHANTIKERHRANLRSDPVLAAATFLAEVSILDPSFPRPSATPASSGLLRVRREGCRSSRRDRPVEAAVSSSRSHGVQSGAPVGEAFGYPACPRHQSKRPVFRAALLSR